MPLATSAYYFRRNQHPRPLRGYVETLCKLEKGVSPSWWHSQKPEYQAWEGNAGWSTGCLPVPLGSHVLQFCPQLCYWSQGHGDGQLVTIHALGICKKNSLGLKSLKDRKCKPPLQRSKLSEHSQVGPSHTRVNCSLKNSEAR